MMNNDLSNYNYHDGRIDSHDDNVQKRVSGYSLFDRDETIFEGSYNDMRKEHSEYDDTIFGKVLFTYKHYRSIDTLINGMLFNDTASDVPYS